MRDVGIGRRGRGVTCLHPHEDAPGTVGAGIDQAGEETAHQEWDIGVVDADVLGQVPACSSAGPCLLLAQQRSLLRRDTVHGGSKMEGRVHCPIWSCSPNRTVLGGQNVEVSRS